MSFNFGLLNALLSRTGMSKVGFAEKHGFKYDTLTKWTYGQGIPNKDNTEKLANALKVPVEFLHSNTNEVEMLSMQTAFMNWCLSHMKGEREVKDEHIEIITDRLDGAADQFRAGESSEELPTTSGESALDRPVDAVPCEQSTMAPEQKYAKLVTEGTDS